MSTIAGTWDLKLKTPIGTLDVVYTFTERDGSLTGSAESARETVPLRDIVVDGDHVTWRQSVSKPIRLNLDFDVTASGDTLSGHSRSGRLPRSMVTGRRRGA